MLLATLVDLHHVGLLSEHGDFVADKSWTITSSLPFVMCGKTARIEREFIFFLTVCVCQKVLILYNKMHKKPLLWMRTEK